MLVEPVPLPVITANCRPRSAGSVNPVPGELALGGMYTSPSGRGAFVLYLSYVDEGRKPGPWGAAAAPSFQRSTTAQGLRQSELLPVMICAVAVALTPWAVMPTRLPKKIGNGLPRV